MAEKLHHPFDARRDDVLEAGHRDVRLGLGDGAAGQQHTEEGGDLMDAEAYTAANG